MTSWQSGCDMNADRGITYCGGWHDDVHAEIKMLTLVLNCCHDVAPLLCVFNFSSISFGFFVHLAVSSTSLRRVCMLLLLVVVMVRIHAVTAGDVQGVSHGRE